MKEQGKDFDPSKEPVTKETIGKIFKECQRIFTTGKDGFTRTAWRDNDREGYAPDGKKLEITTTDHAVQAELWEGKYIINISDHVDEDERLRRYDIKITDEHNEFSYKYALSYGQWTNHDYAGHKLVYSKKSVFLVFFLTAFKGAWDEIEENLTPLAKEKATELFSEGTKMGKISWHVKKFPDSPYYSFFRPNEANAKGLLTSLKSMQDIKVIRNSPNF